jgi:leucyl/phenylalanyl-tRNA---protein transferase
MPDFARRPLAWLEAGEAFPQVSAAWGSESDAPGLLAAGGTLDTATLTRAYSQGIFPWYSSGQPILWWSTDPRMVLPVQDFRFHRSLKKALRHLLMEGRLDLRFDHDFSQVIRACASSPRGTQRGTWILPAMVSAYTALHEAGAAHSVEAWIDGRLAGGLYVVNLGEMVFGESMFSRQTDASKLALCGLVAFCRATGIALIDCQQETRHLASLGARVMSRDAFSRHLAQTVLQPAPSWKFENVYWTHLIPDFGDQA